MMYVLASIEEGLSGNTSLTLIEEEGESLMRSVRSMTVFSEERFSETTVLTLKGEGESFL